MNRPLQHLLLVGDNPFHGISHLSQERARGRGADIIIPVNKAADVVSTSIANGANGFSFSVSSHTLSILRALRKKGIIDQIKLYAMVPYSFEYVRIATQTGTPSLVKKLAKQIVLSGDTRTIFQGVLAIPSLSLEGIVKTYLSYEISRIKAATGRNADLTSITLNEVIVDMGLALGLKWLFTTLIDYCYKMGMTPGVNTRNFPYLIGKFKEWNIDVKKLLIVTPFNKAGFQMNPSKEECEKALSTLPDCNVLAISVLAAGYLRPPEALNYLIGLKNIKGILVGVSSEQQAQTTFSLFKDLSKF